MIDFDYYNPAKIVFGEHSEQKLKSLLTTYGVKRNENSDIVQSQVTLDDLFKA